MTTLWSYIHVHKLYFSSKTGTRFAYIVYNKTTKQPKQGDLNEVCNRSVSVSN
jgi:hypothetical protein